MDDLLQALLLIICGIILLFIGHWLFFGPMSPIYPYLPWSKKPSITKGKPGDPQVCPVCSMRMLRGELVKTIAFATGIRSRDRIVHIKGCYSCLEKNLPRRCPVCRAKLTLNDFLVSRMFERSNRKNHIHVLGCNKCRKV